MIYTEKLETLFCISTETWRFSLQNYEPQEPHDKTVCEHWQTRVNAAMPMEKKSWEQPAM